jgi:hypothetical protein
MLVIAAVAYFGVPAGEAYLRYVRYQDAMRQAVKFADRTSDAAIRRRLVAFADSIELPPEARQVAVRREGGRISVASEYAEWIAVPFGSRALHFSPHAEGEF